MTDLLDGVADVLAGERTPVDAELEPFPLALFHSSRAMWAANYFVLWPLGLTLAATFDTSPLVPDSYCGQERVHGAHVEADGTCAGAALGDAKSLDVRHWVFPGELGETINQSTEENNADYRAFLGFVRERFAELKPDDRRFLLKGLIDHSLATAEQVLLAVDP